MTRTPIWTLLLGCAALAGCTATSTSNTARTSTEQLLVANAVDQALDRVNFRAFDGYNVYLQDKYVDCVDKNYVVASARHRLLRAGAKLVEAPDKADVVVELRAGAVGTSSSDAFMGMPEIVLPGMLTLPEVRFVEKKKQEGTAKIGVVAYDPATNAILGEGGISLARSEESNWYVAGIGPYQNGNVKDEVKRARSVPVDSRERLMPNSIAFRSPQLPPTGNQFAGQLLPPNAEAPGVSRAVHSSEEANWAK